MRIIAFGYQKRTGKDTAVKFALSFVRQHYSKISCERLSFADQIKGIAYDMFSWGGIEDAVYYENNPLKREEILPAIGRSPRQIWDEIGNLGAGISPKIWPEIALKNAADVDYLFCPDLRRPMEIEYVRRFNGKVVRVDRVDAPKSQHPVDHALDGFNEWDAIIPNNGSLREYSQKVKSLICGFLNPTLPYGDWVCPLCFTKGAATPVIGDGYRCTKCQKIFP